MDCVSTVQNTISIINSLSYFANILRSRKNQSPKFEAVAVFVRPKKINGLDLEFGTHKSQERRSKHLRFITNISNYMYIQWLKF